MRTWFSLLKMPKRATKPEDFVPRKRAHDDNIPAGQKLKHDVDAMGCLILAVTRDNRDLHEKLAKLRKENERLQLAVTRTESYVTELECRMEAMEEVIKRSLVQDGAGLKVLGVVHSVTTSNDFVGDDLERIISEMGLENDFDVMDGWEDWLNEPDMHDIFQ